MRRSSGYYPSSRPEVQRLVRLVSMDPGLLTGAFGEVTPQLGTTFESAISSIATNAEGVIHSVGDTKSQAISDTIGHSWAWIVGGVVVLLVTWKLVFD